MKTILVRSLFRTSITTSVKTSNPCYDVILRALLQRTGSCSAVTHPVWPMQIDHHAVVLGQDQPVVLCRCFSEMVANLPQRKAQTVSLPWSMIGILAKNDHLHFVKGCECKCVEDFTAGRMDFLASSFPAAENHQETSFSLFQKRGEFWCQLVSSFILVMVTGYAQTKRLASGGSGRSLTTRFAKNKLLLFCCREVALCVAGSITDLAKSLCLRQQSPCAGSWRGPSHQRRLRL